MQEMSFSPEEAKAKSPVGVAIHSFLFHYCLTVKGETGICLSQYNSLEPTETLPFGGYRWIRKGTILQLLRFSLGSCGFSVSRIKHCLHLSPLFSTVLNQAVRWNYIYSYIVRKESHIWRNSELHNGPESELADSALWADQLPVLVNEL